MQALRQRLASLVGDRRGNVAILFALCMVPMIGLIGLGTDYAGALRAKAALDAGVDAAVLAAVTTASQVIATQSSTNYDPTPAAIAQGKVAAQQVFTSNMGLFVTKSNPQFSISMTRNGLVLNASANYTAVSPTLIGGIFGSNLINIAGAASSNLTIQKYINVYVAIDISQSMGIADTSTAMTQLFALTQTTANQGGGCVFGCHVKTGSQQTTNELLAHNNNIPLRIDSVRQAMLDMINTAQSITSGPAFIKIGLYTIQNGLNTLVAPTSDYNSLQTQANLIDLGNNTSSGTGDSNHTAAVTSLASIVPASGDGSGPNNTQNYVFLLTDGVQDVPGSCPSGHCTQAFDPSLCQAFKLNQVTVGVIYTTYLPIYNDGTHPSSGYETNYNALVAPFAAQIAPNMQTCASPGSYYIADDGPAIHQAVQTLFASATSMARLTQ